MGKRKRKKLKKGKLRRILVRQVHPSTGRTVRPLSPFAYGEPPY